VSKAQTVRAGRMVCIGRVHTGGSAGLIRTTCPSFTDGPPVTTDSPRPPYGRSVLVGQIRLSHFLLELCLLFATCLDLFLGLAVPL
jgi:hypothetical protein